ncbi:MAG: bifunctional nuclease family protein [Dehalococcoidia bacterium]|nr:MAG: bifunctional nuclease family protein [Dehalococcoidia bacterium]
MNLIPKDCVELKYQRVVRLRGQESMLPFALLEDGQKRTIAVPLDPLEAALIQLIHKGNSSSPKPYNTLVSCLCELGFNVKAVEILYNDEIDLYARLILSKELEGNVEIEIPCVEGIACAQLSKAPIYVSRELMSSISADAPQAVTTK